MVDGGREGQRGEMANAGIVRASAPAWASAWQSAGAAGLISWGVGSRGNDAAHLFLAGLELLDFAPTTAQAKMKPTGPLTQSSVPIVPTFPDDAAKPSNRWSLTMFVWDIALLSQSAGCP